MNTSATPTSIYRRLPKWLLWLLCGVIFVILIIGTTLFFLPEIVSTGWFRHRMEQQASLILKRNVQIGNLHWTWSRGIQLEGLRIDDDPAFSDRPIISMEGLSILPELSGIFKSSLPFDLKVEGLDIRLIRNPDGRTNIEALLASLESADKPEAETAQKAPQPLSFSIPFDLKACVEVSDTSIKVLDRISDQTLTAHDISLLLEAPSLLREPVSLRLSMEQELNSNPIPPVRLFLRVENLVAPQGILSPDKAGVTLEGDIPGLRFNLKGEVYGTLLEGDVQMELAPLLAAARPFIPSPLPDASGKMRLEIAVSWKSLEEIHVDTKVTGNRLAASGGPLKTFSLGPLDFSLLHKGTVDLANWVLNTKNSEIRIQEKSSIFWNGTITNLKGPAPIADLIIGPVFLDLEEIYGLSEALIPAGFSVSIDGMEDIPGGEAGIHVQELRISGPLISGPVKSNLEDFSLSIPHMRADMDDLSLSADHINLQVKRGDFLVESAFPVRLEILAGMDAGNIRVNAGHKMGLEKMNIPLVNIAASDIELSPKALFGVSTKIMLQESVEMEGITMPYASLPEMCHSLRAAFYLDKGPLAAINVEELLVTGPFLSVEGILDNPIETGIDLDVQIADLQLKDLKPLRADIEKVSSSLDIDKLLHANLEVSAYELGSESLDITGQAKLIVGNLEPLIPANILSKVDLEGTIDVGYELHGRLPTNDEISKLTSNERELTEILRQNEFLKDFRVTVSLKDLGLNMPLGDDSILRVSQIQSDDPLQLILENGLKNGRADGKLIVHIEDLPALGRLEKPIILSLAFSFDQQDLKSLNISESITTDFLGVNQSASIFMDNMDQFLAAGLHDPLPLILKKLDGFVTGNLRAKPGTDLDLYTTVLSLEGLIEAGAELFLEGGSNIKLRTWLESTGIDADLESAIKVANLESHMSMEKSYALVLQDGINPQEKSGQSFLSSRVLNPESGQEFFTNGWKSASQRIKDDLRGRLAPQRSISFDSARFLTGPLPLEIQNHEMELSFVRGLPRIDYFQMDLMGGTVAGTLSLSKDRETFLIRADCSLSGLNASRLLPDVIQGISGEEAELSGSLSLSFPMYTNARRLLQDLNMDVTLTHIGSRTLERLLYALDPYESNETIVNQRKLLRLGSPRWIRLVIENGALSLSGQVQVKGISMDLPRIERINLADLPLQGRLEPVLSSMGLIIELLEIISSDSIYIGDDGIIRVEGER